MVSDRNTVRKSIWLALVLLSIGLIAMTAHAMQGDRERCMEAGMNDYVTKQISPQALAEVLDKWLPKDEKKMMNDECGMMNKQEPATDVSHSSLLITPH